MNPEAQRIAIAEACGWKRVKQESGLAWGSDADKNRCWMFIHQLPNYLSDLNAMHSAEEVLLTGNDWKDRLSRYSSKLMCVMEDTDPGRIPVAFHGDRVGLRYYTLHATAAQRAEAFLRAIGKWEEKP